ncbi:hypothetical protein SAMN05216223_118130 [Actinacidiphila yanglinensis]|uniref:Uncharacterized protein n=1 Tax=Actinacidiphila yanglinensis TaxID=310779 RepID=A0A1H6DQI0_9ACTN|nr:hypothetical protein [Actinacidiphila yanglinensis]SEG87622.1 hypothetical protein SAMN05216223_118130 [Actinacidiphila yanglinensis]
MCLGRVVYALAVVAASWVRALPGFGVGLAVSLVDVGAVALLGLGWGLAVVKVVVLAAAAWVGLVLVGGVCVAAARRRLGGLWAWDPGACGLTVGGASWVVRGFVLGGAFRVVGSGPGLVGVRVAPGVSGAGGVVVAASDLAFLGVFGVSGVLSLVLGGGCLVVDVAGVFVGVPGVVRTEVLGDVFLEVVADLPWVPAAAGVRVLRSLVGGVLGLLGAVPVVVAGYGVPVRGGVVVFAAPWLSPVDPAVVGPGDVVLWLFPRVGGLMVFVVGLPDLPLLEAVGSELGGMAVALSARAQALPLFSAALGAAQDWWRRLAVVLVLALLLLLLLVGAGAVALRSMAAVRCVKVCGDWLAVVGLFEAVFWVAVFEVLVAGIAGGFVLVVLRRGVSGLVLGFLVGVGGLDVVLVSARVFGVAVVVGGAGGVVVAGGGAVGSGGAGRGRGVLCVGAGPVRGLGDAVAAGVGVGWDGVVRREVSVACWRVGALVLLGGGLLGLLVEALAAGVRGLAGAVCVHCPVGVVRFGGVVVGRVGVGGGGRGVLGVLVVGVCGRGGAAGVVGPVWGDVGGFGCGRV